MASFPLVLGGGGGDLDHDGDLHHFLVFLGDVGQGLAAVAVFAPVGRPAERAQPPDVLDQAVDRLGQLLPFGGRGPHEPDAIGLDAQRGERVLEHVKSRAWSCSSDRCSGIRRGGSRR